MKWIKFTLDTHTDAVDLLSYMLDEAGVEGIEIEDHVPLSESDKKQMYVDLLPDPVYNDGSAKIHFYIEPEKCHPEEITLKVTQMFQEIKQYANIGKGTVSRSETEDKDWMNNWKEFFHQFYIDDLLVTPSWEEVKPEDRDKKVLHIDPGTAFGTGMHETTQLCIRELKKYITPDTVLLDVGTGSGILAIVALMYGIKEAAGTDLDPCALEAVRENMEMNEVSPEAFRMMIGNIITDKEIQDRAGYEKYDIVVANILAEVLLPLTPVIKQHLKKGGIYITSGIIAEKEQLVTDAVKAAGMEVLEVTKQNEWVSVTARMP